jgi:tetratricopeptide (TPR) repeat protein
MILLNPNDGNSNHARARVYWAKGDPVHALEDLNLALQIGGQIESTKLLKSWILATCVDGSLRDGKLALKLAQEVRQKLSDRDDLGLKELAAAYAEVGNFRQSVEIQTKLHALSTNDVDPYALEQYVSRKPYRSWLMHSSANVLQFPQQPDVTTTIGGEKYPSREREQAHDNILRSLKAQVN